FGVDDDSLENAFNIELLQYMVWVMEAGVFASDDDAQIVNCILGKQLDSGDLDTLMGDEEFLPLDFELEEPPTFFALARLLLMLGREDPGELILPAFERIGVSGPVSTPPQTRADEG
ncbi:MAG: hypothetical protein ACI4NA_06445, partial [Succinivibrio sp.]